jgi:hypothetical protein
MAPGSMMDLKIRIHLQVPNPGKTPNALDNLAGVQNKTQQYIEQGELTESIPKNANVTIKQ